MEIQGKLGGYAPDDAYQIQIKVNSILITNLTVTDNNPFCYLSHSIKSLILIIKIIVFDSMGIPVV